MSKSYGNQLILNNITLSVKQGEFFFLLGPSGCGKTTLLRSISGLVTPDSGSISLNGSYIHDLPAHKRDVHTVFQNYALFPHMNVYDNISFGLRMKKKSGSLIKNTVANMLDLVGLSSFAERMPSQLSGGQMQRVALARALANSPSLLLLDEPLGALDVKLRKQMQNELRKIQKEIGTTFICVTHDQEEALTIGDRIAVMNAGNLEQIGTSEELYNSPATYFVCDFLGESNFFEITEQLKSNTERKFKVQGSDDPCFAPLNSEQVPSRLAIRPEMLTIFNDIDHCFKNKLIATVVDVRFAGAFYEVESRTNSGKLLTTRVPSAGLNTDFEVGMSVFLSWKPENGILL